MPAREDLRVLVRGKELDRMVDGLRSLVLERRRDHAPPPSALASWIARHTRSGDAGFPTSVTPRWLTASTTALITAGGDAIVPASPIPFTPSGFVVDGVTVRSSV